MNLDNNEKIDTCKHAWSVNVKMFIDHVIKESGEERKFGCLPVVGYNPPAQLGALNSESFSKRMISAANLLVHAHRLHLNDDVIDKLIVLHMDRKLIDRIRSTFFLLHSLRTLILTRRLKLNLLSFF